MASIDSRSAKLSNGQITLSQPVRGWLLALNCTSLDAVLVAVGWGWLFAQSSHATVPPSAIPIVVLALVTWLIYAGDRLLDAARMDPSSPMAVRHRFSLKHRRALAVVWVAVALATAFVVTRWLPTATLMMGLQVAGLVAVYFMIVHARPMRILSIPKELVVGAVFALGCLVPGRCEIAMNIEVCLFAMLCMLNCIVFAWGQAHVDRLQSANSLVKSWPQITANLPWIAAGISLLTLFGVATDTLTPVLGIALGIGFAGIAGLACWMQSLAGREQRSVCLLADHLLIVLPICVWLADQFSVAER